MVIKDLEDNNLINCFLVQLNLLPASPFTMHHRSTKLHPAIGLSSIGGRFFWSFFGGAKKDIENVFDYI